MSVDPLEKEDTGNSLLVRGGVGVTGQLDHLCACIACHIRYVPTTLRTVNDKGENFSFQSS
jgi:hypothetical protein